jgi:DNA-binding transcriptional regulator YiaG
LTAYKHFAYSRFVSARDFKIMRRRKGYSQSQLARELDVHVLTVSKWEREVVPIPRMAEMALSSLKPRRKTEKGD